FIYPFSFFKNEWQKASVGNKTATMPEKSLFTSHCFTSSFYPPLIFTKKKPKHFAPRMTKVLRFCLSSVAILN
ncbi:hypothetical protein ACN01J_28255, partial [Klebsiella pneumoniae]